MVRVKPSREPSQNDQLRLRGERGVHSKLLYRGGKVTGQATVTVDLTNDPDVLMALNAGTLFGLVGSNTSVQSVSWCTPSDSHGPVLSSAVPVTARPSRGTWGTG